MTCALRTYFSRDFGLPAEKPHDTGARMGNLYDLGDNLLEQETKTNR